MLVQRLSKEGNSKAVCREGICKSIKTKLCFHILLRASAITSEVQNLLIAGNLLRMSFLIHWDSIRLNSLEGQVRNKPILLFSLPQAFTPKYLKTVLTSKTTLCACSKPQIENLKSHTLIMLQVLT